MNQITLKGQPVKVSGELPRAGEPAPDFTLTGEDLKELTRKDFQGKRLILNIFPSIDTPTCATSARKFNQKAGDLADVAVLDVSMDLPFAHKRFCAAEGLTHVVAASAFRHPEFAEAYGVRIEEGPMKGLLARSVVVLDEKGQVIHSQRVEEISQEPDYDAALQALQGTGTKA